MVIEMPNRKLTQLQCDHLLAQSKCFTMITPNWEVISRLNKQDADGANKATTDVYVQKGFIYRD